MSQSSLAVLFGASCLVNQASGVFHSLQQTASTLSARGHRISVVGTRPPGTELGQGWPDSTFALPQIGPVSLGLAEGLTAVLDRHMKDIDVASLQMPWMQSNAIITAFCRRRSIPFMVALHGTLHPEALRISSWKKQLASRTYLREMFRRAECFQALTEEEYRHVRAAGLKSPVCIIGNGVDIPAERNANDPVVVPEHLRGVRIGLYLGRLHPIKGLDRLIPAWAHSAPSDWKLVLVGNGDARYVSALHQLANSHGPERFHFAGPAFGPEKSAWIRAAELMVLPSYSEGFPMTVLEGLAHRRPTLLTDACGMRHLAQVGALFEVANTAPAIADGLRLATGLSGRELREAGEIGFDIVRDRFSWSRVAGQLEDVFGWMLGGGPTPETVRLT